MSAEKPTEHRKGLLAAWNLNQTGRWKIGTPLDLESSSTNTTQDQVNDQAGSEKEEETKEETKEENRRVSHLSYKDIPVEINSPSGKVPNGKGKADKLTKKEAEVVKTAVGKYLKKKRKGLGSAKEKKETQFEDSEKQQRRLAKLAWVLEKLKPARTCVAVLLTDNALHIYANKHDKEFKQDAVTLMSLVDTSIDDYKKIYKGVEQKEEDK